MKRTAVIFAIALLLAACNSNPVQDAEGSTDTLRKDVYTMQADELGDVVFQIPDHDPSTGLPLVQTYEHHLPKFEHVLLARIDHSIDARGVVYVVTEPGVWVVIVVVR